MRHHFSRFISQSINRFPKPTTHSSRVKTPSRSPNLIRRFSDTVQESDSAPPERVPAIVDEISGLTLLEISDLTEVLRTKWGIENMPLMVVMTSGLAPPMPVAIGKVAEEEVEKKEDKKSFDLKLEGGFDVAARIKIIKEVRAVTDLGLKEAKDLVEKAPTLLKKGVTKEEAEKIIAKMKEVGAKVIME